MRHQRHQLPTGLSLSLKAVSHLGVTRAITASVGRSSTEGVGFSSLSAGQLRASIPTASIKQGYGVRTQRRILPFELSRRRQSVGSTTRVVGVSCCELCTPHVQD